MNGNIELNTVYLAILCPLYLLLQISQNVRQLIDAHRSKQAACTKPMVPEEKKMSLVFNDKNSRPQFVGF